MKQFSRAVVVLVFALWWFGGTAQAQLSPCFQGHYSGQVMWPLNGTTVTSDMLLDLDSCFDGGATGHLYTTPHTGGQGCWYGRDPQHPCSGLQYPYPMPSSNLCPANQGGVLFLCTASICSNPFHGGFSTARYIDQGSGYALVNIYVQNANFDSDPNCPTMPSQQNIEADSYRGTCDFYAECYTNFHLYMSPGPCQGSQCGSGHLVFNP